MTTQRTNLVPTPESPNELVEHLRRPVAYPWRPANVDLIQTHISWVFLAGDYVVKIKRPVAYDFVDHTTLAARHQSCLDEIRLNRRLTTNVYLDVVPIVHDGAAYVVDGAGTPVEWATLMRRLPADRMLDELITAATAPVNLADILANRLIPFHRDIAAPCGSTPAGSAEQLAAVLVDNLNELHAFAGSLLPPQQLSMVDASMQAFLNQHSSLLQQRISDGWIREGHGDLRAEHVCIEPGSPIQIFDCVEFNQALRCADVASDLAFLLMDLSRLGAGDAAARLAARYREAKINLPPSLLNLYRAHRALVRAKVECLSVAGSSARPARLDMATYLDLATRATVTTEPVLIVMSGLSGTGKSTVARTLGHALGLSSVVADVIRKELAGVRGPTPAAQLPRVYSQDMTDATYAEVLNRAAAMLRQGNAVIADATFLDSRRRTRAAEVAAQAGAPMMIVETICDEMTVAARLRARQDRGADPSDAGLTIYQQQRTQQRRRPAAVPLGATRILVDTTMDRPDILDPVFAALRQSGIIEARVPEHDATFT